MHYRKRWSLILIVLCLLFSSSYVVYKKYYLANHLPGSDLHLGKVDFPTSTRSTQAQVHFLLGVRYLHNFMYPLALREFTFAKKIDPTFALSYWGIAMSHYYSLWSFVDKAKGLQILYALEDAKSVVMSPLEKSLIDAITHVYSDGAVVENDKKYLHAMNIIYQQYPGNVEVASFYALALLAYQADAPFDKHANDYRQQAQSILKPFINTHPNHPGVIHYYIHATDIPNQKVAKEGLVVIPNVLVSLSDSSHVLHMPSHLYTELGMWPQAIKANKLSIIASNHLCRFLESENIQLDVPLSMCGPFSTKAKKWMSKAWYGCDAANIYHSTEWLHYEYLQLGRYNEAEKIVQSMKKIADVVNEPMYLYWLYRTQARQIIYSKNWSPLTALPDPITRSGGSDNLWAAFSECSLLLADGLKAIYNQQYQFVEPIEKRFQTILDILKDHDEGGFRSACQVMQIEFLAAKTFYLQQQSKKAFSLLEQAVVLKSKTDNQLAEFTLTLPVIPLQEFYAQLLMAQSTPANLHKTVVLLQNVLKIYPQRTEALKALTRAYAKLDNVQAMNYWQQALIKQFQLGDSLTELKELRV